MKPSSSEANFTMHLNRTTLQISILNSAASSLSLLDIFKVLIKVHVKFISKLNLLGISQFVDASEKFYKRQS